MNPPPAIDRRGETSLAHQVGFGAERADIKQRRGLKAFRLGGGAPDRRMASVDDFQGINPCDEILIEAQHVKNLLRLETDVGVDEEEVGGLRRLQELTDERIAAAGDQRIMAEQGNRRIEARGGLRTASVRESTACNAAKRGPRNRAWR
jgi:hypothetical protein